MRRQVATSLLVLIGLTLSACDRPAAPSPPTSRPAPKDAATSRSSRKNQGPWGADALTLDPRASQSPDPLATLTRSGNVWPGNPDSIQPAARRTLRAGQCRTLPPAMGGWWTWLQAEMECDRLVMTVGYESMPRPWEEFDRLRDLARESPSAAVLWALLLRDHRDLSLRGLVVNSIRDPKAGWLHTPEIRQIVWDSKDAGIAYTDTNAMLAMFGPDQLQSIDDAELLRQLATAVMGYSQTVEDEVFELYLREVLRRKLIAAVPILERGDSYRSPHRTLMMRNTRNRCLGKPDAITFKVTRHADDPRLLQIELALTDMELTQYDLARYEAPPCHVDVSLEMKSSPMRLWMEKWPDTQVLTAGKPYRTAVSTAFMREAHKVRVALRLWNIDTASQPKSPLLPGPRMMDWTVDFDMPGQ